MKHKRLLLPCAALALAAMMSVPVVPTLSLFTDRTLAATNTIIFAYTIPDDAESYYDIESKEETDQAVGVHIYGWWNNPINAIQVTNLIQGSFKDAWENSQGA
jgi:hypothetical protein